MVRESELGTAMAVESSSEQKTTGTSKAEEIGQDRSFAYRELAEEDYLARHFVFFDFQFDQLRSLHQYQHELVQISIESINRKPGSEERFRTTFKEYVESLQRLQWFMGFQRVPIKGSKKIQARINKELGQHSGGSPYYGNNIEIIGLSTPDPLRSVLKYILPRRLAEEDPENWGGKKGPVGDPESKPARDNETQIISPFVDRTARFLIAIFGGLLLMGPMIAMSLVTVQNNRIIIASVFVFAFSVFLSFISGASNQEVLAGSAAYAAVIVVFIGSALGSQ